ncbi:MAG: glycosyltransferase family 4 protein [Planctomycetota bacterium]
MIRAIRERPKKIAFISSYSPRKCGIATFASDLIDNMGLAGGGEFEPLVIAMQSGPELKYEKPVRLKIRKNVKYDYVHTADYINFSDVDIVSVQHEFGLFGGEGGSYLSLLLKKLRKPVVTTLHTVLERPSAEYLYPLMDVCEASEKVIVMNKRGIKMLRDIYDVPAHKIELIPHGMPDLPFADSSYYKRKLGLAGRKIILTFGLLSRNKGVEVVLKALPRVVGTEPSVLYVVLGATHPEVLRHEGQSYKCMLEKMVRDLGLQRNVVFDNRFVDDEELHTFLGAADVYVTPYLHKEQMTSGTLAFAVGAGKAVVSTPYWAAQELLAKGRGKLVRFGDSKHTAGAIAEILTNNSFSSRMRRLAYDYGRSMTWPEVGRSYWELFSTQVPSAPVTFRPRLDLQEWKVPSYIPQQAYQPA